MEISAMILLFTVLAILIEAVIEAGKIVVAKPAWEQLVAFLFGGLLAYFYKIPFFSYLPIEAPVNGVLAEILSIFFVAILMLRYSGKINDLLNWLELLKKKVV